MQTRQAKEKTRFCCGYLYALEPQMGIYNDWDSLDQAKIFIKLINIKVQLCVGSTHNASFGSGVVLKQNSTLPLQVRWPQICINRNIGTVYWSEHQRNDYRFHTRVCKSHFGIFGWVLVVPPWNSNIQLNNLLEIAPDCLHCSTN